MSESQPVQRSRPAGGRTAELVRGVLDGVLLAGLLLTAAYLVFGSVDLGFLSIRRISKPFLVLVVLLGVRLGLPGPSALTRVLPRPRWRPHGPWAEAAIDAAAAFLPAVIGAKLVAFVANLIFPSAMPRPFQVPFEAAKFAETFAAWDAGWYWHIARNGYFYEASGQSSVAFFPLYPLLMRAVAWPFGGTDRALWIAGMVLSLGCFAAALTVLHRLTVHWFGEREVARRTLLYVAVFPFAFFFAQVYTESLFLFLSVSAVHAASRGRWWLAGLLGGLTALTRPNGILIAAPLGLMALRGGPAARTLLLRLIALLQVPLGFVLFCGFVQRLTGDPLGWLRAQEHWGYSVGNSPWVELMRVLDWFEKFGPYGYFFADPLAFPFLLHGGVGLAGLLLLPRVFRCCGPALGAYAALTLAVPLTGNSLEGIGRYLATAFPFFMLLGATIRSRRGHEALLVSGALGLALLAALFVTLHKVY